MFKTRVLQQRANTYYAQYFTVLTVHNELSQILPLKSNTDTSHKQKAFLEWPHNKGLLGEFQAVPAHRSSMPRLPSSYSHLRLASLSPDCPAELSGKFLTHDSTSLSEDSVLEGARVSYFLNTSQKASLMTHVHATQ